MTALKYTDRDVRERPELVAEAIRYLRWYQGEFEFLVDAKRYLEANGTLPIATSRGVLNCIRQDARYAMVADPIPEPDPRLARYAGFNTPKRVHPLRVVEDEEERREPFNLKTYWNARLLYSSHKGAEVVHALRYRGLVLRYYPMGRHDGDKYFLYGGMRAICSANFSMATQRLAREMPPGKRFCHRCVDMLTTDYKDYEWGPTTRPPILELM